MQTSGIIILAAGTSSRLGQPKQLLQYNGKSLVQLSLKAAVQAALGPVILVTGANAEAVKGQVNDEGIYTINNTAWQEGIASSIRCGLGALLNILPGAEHGIFMVCDQPFVTPKLVNLLLITANNTGKGIVACAYSGTIGIPAIFNKTYFPMLAQLQDDEGAKKIMRRYRADVATVDFPEGGIDIDTTDDYEKLGGECRF